MISTEMKMPILSLITMITHDHQDIDQRLQGLRAQLNSVTLTSTLALLYDLQDILILYQHIKHMALYTFLPADQQPTLIRFAELHFQTTTLLKRGISSLKRRDLPRYAAQLNIFTATLWAYLEEEYHYFQQRLPQLFSAAQLEQIADYYEQLKHAGLPKASDYTHLYSCRTTTTPSPHVYA